MAKEIARWRVFCVEDDRNEYVSLPVGSAAPTECPIDPDHTVGKIGLDTILDARIDLSGLLSVPGLTDDIDSGWSVGSLIQSTDGNLWRCEDSTVGAAYWRDLSGGFPALTLDYAEVGSPDGRESTSSSYEALPRFRFPGRMKAGRPIKIVALCKVDNAVGQVRLFDVSSAKTIAESATFANTEFAEIDFGAITNTPNSSAIWEVQVKRVTGSGSNKVYVSFVTIEF